MKMYSPPFSITNEMVSLISEISDKLGRISNYKDFESKPHIRRNNRIKSIHSSLAIEANSLSMDEVRAVVNGKTVIGSRKEIQEVKNAYSAYEQIGSFDPYSIEELKRLHGILTKFIVDESGTFRHGEEGVFDGDECIFMAPPAHLVPQLMDDLFSWMQNEKASIHPLILSSVFHYEFVFIHPFADGNGRMARLWQTALLSMWKPVFKYLPIESHIYKFQTDYYNAISKCHVAGNSDAFIVFMLTMINSTLDELMQQAASSNSGISEQVKRLLSVMEYGEAYTAKRIMELLCLKSKEALRKNYLNPAIKDGLVIMSEPDKPTSRNQTYIKQELY